MELEAETELFGEEMPGALTEMSVDVAGRHLISM